MSLGQPPFQKPRVLNTSNGLSINRVMTVAEDEEGFAWIGTEDGLFKYDGTLLQSYYADKEDSTALYSDYILDLLPDTENRKIWIGTIARTFYFRCIQ